MDDGLIPSNPASRIGKWNRKRSEREAEGADPFSAAELEAIATAAREQVPVLWPLVGLWAQTGARAGEVFGLQWKDLNLEAGTAVVRRTLSQGRLGSPKTGRNRTVKVSHSILERPETVLEALRGLRSVREAEAAVAGRDLEPEAYVFTRPDGRPFQSISHHWQRCLRLAGVRYRNPSRSGTPSPPPSSAAAGPASTSRSRADGRTPASPSSTTAGGSPGRPRHRCNRPQLPRN